MAEKLNKRETGDAEPHAQRQELPGLAPVRRPPSSTNYSGAHSDEVLVERWLHGKSPATAEVYRSAYAAFMRFTSSKLLGNVTLGDLQEFADELEDPFAPSTQAKILAALKSLISFGHQTGYLAFDVGKALNLPKRRDELAERILSPDDVHSMIAKAEGQRDRTLLRTLYIGGLRVAEAVSLRSRDLRERPGTVGNASGTEGTGAGQITLFGKGGKTRRVLLPAGLFEELDALALPDPQAPIFRSRKRGPDGEPMPIGVRQAERIVKSAAKKAGLKTASEVSPHWLRHAHASHAMERGAKVYLVQATLGHASVATTGRYLHARPEESSALFLGG